MNKKANVFLNSFEFLFFSISLISMGAFLNAHTLQPFVRYSIFSISILFGMLFIAIELFLWILMNGKSKFLDIAYLLVELICCVYATTKIPFSGLFLLLGFSFMKDSLRIAFVKKLYIPKEFDYYCKMFGIKVKDFKKKKKVPTKKPTLAIPEEDLGIVEAMVEDKKPKVVRKKTA